MKLSESEILVVGGGLWGLLLSERLSRKTTSLCFLPTPEPSHLAPPLPVHIGTGEPPRNAEKVFGESLFRAVWSASEKNMQIAKSLCADLGVDCQLDTLIWEEGTLERSQALQLDFQALQKALRKKLESRKIAIHAVEKPIQVSGAQPFKYTLRGGSGLTYQSSLVIWLDEPNLGNFFASFKDKLIPATLSSFLYPASPKTQGVLHLFNKGADFAAVEPTGLRLGSYRNLYSDTGVGLREGIDPKTLQGVKAFFKTKKWIGDEEPLQSFVNWEHLSCDGLGCVGSLSEAPGVYVAAGFAGRMQNFIFLISEAMARWASGEKFSDLDVFSPRRFV